MFSQPSTPKFARRVAVALGETLDPGLGFTLTPFAAPGKTPLYAEPRDDAALELGVEGETTVGVEIVGGGARAYYLPSCARMTPALRARLVGADLLFLDGTTYEDDEMIRSASRPRRPGAWATWR